MRPEMMVGGVQIFTAEEQAGVAMACDAGRIGRGGAVVGFVSGIEHHLGAVQFEQDPIAVVPRFGPAEYLEAQHVAIKLKRGGHIEHLKQWCDAMNVHGHAILPVGGEYIRKRESPTIKLMGRCVRKWLLLNGSGLIKR